MGDNMTTRQITVSDEGWGERDYVEWQDGCWKQFYTTSVYSPHTETHLTDEGRLAIITEFGLANVWLEPFSRVDTMSPATLEHMRLNGQIIFAIEY